MSKKGGWCPECEAEGADPQHTRRTILCGKHHHRKYKQTPTGAAAVEAANTKYSRSDKGREKKAEYWAKYYASEHGRRIVRRRDAIRVQGPMNIAVARQEQYERQPFGSSPNKEDEK